jgi:hypothetical protein
VEPFFCCFILVVLLFLLPLICFANVAGWVFCFFIAAYLLRKCRWMVVLLFYCCLFASQMSLDGCFAFLLSLICFANVAGWLFCFFIVAYLLRKCRWMVSAHAMQALTLLHLHNGKAPVILLTQNARGSFIMNQSFSCCSKNDFYFVCVNELINNTLTKLWVINDLTS